MIQGTLPFARMGVVAVVLALAALPAGGCSRDAEAPDPHAQLAHVHDGEQLFHFMLTNISETVAQIPCSCCGNMLAECYNGACPYNCWSCNAEGRDVYVWQAEGLSVPEIQAKIKAKYFDANPNSVPWPL